MDASLEGFLAQSQETQPGVYGVNLMSTLEHNVCEAIHEHSDGEQVSYSVSMTVVPGDAPGEFVPVAVLVLTIAGVTLGERAYSTNLSMDLHMTQITVSETVAKMIEAMRAQRSEELTKVRADLLRK